MEMVQWLDARRWYQWSKIKMKEGGVSWSNIHITNELREGLLVEIFIQNPGQMSVKTTEQQKGEERRQW